MKKSNYGYDANRECTPANGVTAMDLYERYGEDSVTPETHRPHGIVPDMIKARLDSIAEQRADLAHKTRVCTTILNACTAHNMAIGDDTIEGLILNVLGPQRAA
jgi:hypothetical protein